jgi:18S rRNA (guanine1575-N7)-methyltransferase
MSRPEHTGAADAFYSKGEAQRYDDSARMAATQRALADRALQLLDLPAGVPALLLDAGCGTGYSGRPLEKAGHSWIGTDISTNMLRAAVTARRSQVVCDDLGSGLSFRHGVFDGCVSISAVQWLCHASRPEHDPQRRVRKFFMALRAVLASGARAVLQLYPEQPAHLQMLRDAALAAGFGGGLVVDYPWSERSKKLFLVLISPSRVPAVGAPATSASGVGQRGKQQPGQRGSRRESGGADDHASRSAATMGGSSADLGRAAGIQKKAHKKKKQSAGESSP